MPTPGSFSPQRIEASRDQGERSKEERERDSEAAVVKQEIRQSDQGGRSRQLDGQPSSWSFDGSRAADVGLEGMGWHGRRSRQGPPAARAGARAGKARISAQAVRTLVSSHQPSSTSLRGSLGLGDWRAMMSAMRHPCPRRLQQFRRRSAEAQVFRAVFAQEVGCLSAVSLEPAASAVSLPKGCGETPSLPQ